MMHTRNPFAQIAWCCSRSLHLPRPAACGPDFHVPAREPAVRALCARRPEFELNQLSGYSRNPASSPNTDFQVARTEAEAQGLNEVQVAAIASMREANSAPAALQLSANLPQDVGLYTAGAVAWSLGISGIAQLFGGHRTGRPGVVVCGRRSWKVAHYRLKNLAGSRGF
jgi:hypothetical protein